MRACQKEMRLEFWMPALTCQAERRYLPSSAEISANVVLPAPLQPREVNLVCATPHQIRSMAAGAGLCLM
jgi:hypothetical protein